MKKLIGILTLFLLIPLILFFVMPAEAGTPTRRKYGIRFADEGADHGTPPSGFLDLYVNSDTLYVITDGGSKTSVMLSGTAWDDLSVPDAHATLDMTTYTTTWDFGGTADMFNLDFTGNFGDVSGMVLEQKSGTPTDGTLLELIVASEKVDALTIYNSDIDLATSVTLLTLSFFDDDDSEGIYIKARDDESADTVFQVGQGGDVIISETTLIDENSIDFTAAAALTSGASSAVTISADDGATAGEDFIVVANNVTIAASGAIDIPADTTLAIAIDLTDTNITNSISVGTNVILLTTGTISGGAATIDFTNFDVSGAGAIVGTSLDVGAGNITTSGTISATTIEQDALVSSAGSSLTLRAGAGAGDVDIGTSGGTGDINMGASGAASEVILASGVNLDLVQGDLTIVDTANSDLVTLTNNTITGHDLIQITATGVRTAGALINLVDTNTTTANGITYVNDALTSGNVISITTSGTGLTGNGLFIDISDASYTGAYIYLKDGTNPDFTVKRYGATVISGNASGTDVLTLTAGDLLVTSGHVKVTNGHLTLGSPAVLDWETSVDMQALQVGGSGFFGASTVQAAGDSSYIGHNAYFDDNDSQWEAISTNASDESTMLQMTNGTYIFNTEDTANAADVAITWIPALVIKSTGEVGIGTATAAATDELLHIQSATASKPVLKLEMTAGGATSPIIRSVNSDATANSSGDDFLRIQIAGYDDAGVEVQEAILIQAAADWGDSGTDTPTEILFYTVPDGSDTDTLAVTIASDQSVTIVGDLTVSGGDVALNSAVSEKPITVITNTNTDANGAVIHIVKNGDNAADDDEVGEIRFSGDDDGNTETIMGSIRALSSDVTNAAESGQIDIYAMVNGTERNLISIGGEDTANSAPTEVVINEDTIDVDFRVESDNEVNALFVQGSDGWVALGSNAPVADFDVVGHISSRKYYFVEEFDDGNSGDAVDEFGSKEAYWTVGGTNENDMANFANGVGGVLELVTANSADNDSTTIFGEPVIYTDQNPIIEFRFKVDNIVDAIAMVGLATAAVTEFTAGACTDCMMVGLQEENGISADAVIMFTNDAGAGGTYQDTLINISNGTYVTVRFDLTDPDLPRVWVNNAEIASVTLDVQAGRTLSVFAIVQVIAAGPIERTMTIDYIKVWQDRG